MRSIQKQVGEGFAANIAYNWVARCVLSPHVMIELLDKYQFAAFRALHFLMLRAMVGIEFFSRVIALNAFEELALECCHLVLLLCVPVKCRRRGEIDVAIHAP